tara:strand:+ start:20053 stop:20406 length:354 start_codon:yes stop_codon:yes gene_type:complete
MYYEFRGKRKDVGCEVVVVHDDVEGDNYDYYPLEPTGKHSEGFEWGYGGSGPAETALVILTEFVKKVNRDRRKPLDFDINQYYQMFKWDKITTIKREDDLHITTREIWEWLREKEAI